MPGFKSVFVVTESWVKTKSKLLGSEFGSGNGVQDWSRIQFQGVSEARKMKSGGFHRGQAERKRHQDSLWGQSGTLLIKGGTYCTKETKIEIRFGRVLDRFGD